MIIEIPGFFVRECGDSQPRGGPRAHNGGMGLFASRPEEPTEWAGLPGEPVRTRTRAELLPEDGLPDATPAGLLGLSDASMSSVSISLPAGTVDQTTPVEPGDEPDDDSGDAP